MKFDLLRKAKKTAGICSCDLHSCYDRVEHSFASLAMQRAGDPLRAIQSMFETIHKLKYTVRTCHGDSELGFGGEDWRVPTAENIILAVIVRKWFLIVSIKPF